VGGVGGHSTAVTEDNALSEREGLGVVDSDGLTTHIALPGIRAGLATATGRLLTAESTA